MTAPRARLLVALLLLAALGPRPGWGCACGCGVFDVQTSAVLPTRPGGSAFLEYDYMNQNKNWSGGRRGSDDDNPDKQIRTHFVTAGVQYLFDRSWGVMAELPVWQRYLKTTADGGSLVGANHAAVGDVRLRGVYSGFSPDMSTGLTFGAKLPTGDYTNSAFDRDTEIGTGSTDLLLGAYHMGRIGQDGAWAWFGSLLWDEPVLTMARYRPGAEVGAVLGAYYDGWRAGSVRIAPLAQAVGSIRWRDQGLAAHPEDSGYRRLLLGPGLELGAGGWRANASVGFPVAQYANGNQLVASQFYKMLVSHGF